MTCLPILEISPFSDMWFAISSFLCVARFTLLVENFFFFFFGFYIHEMLIFSECFVLGFGCRELTGFTESVGKCSFLLSSEKRSVRQMSVNSSLNVC